MLSPRDDDPSSVEKQNCLSTSHGTELIILGQNTYSQVHSAVWAAG